MTILWSFSYHFFVKKKNFLFNFQTFDIVLFSRLQNSKKQRSYGLGGDEFGYNSWNTFVL